MMLGLNANSVRRMWLRAASCALLTACSEPPDTMRAAVSDLVVTSHCVAYVQGTPARVELTAVEQILSKARFAATKGNAIASDRLKAEFGRFGGVEVRGFKGPGFVQRPYVTSAPSVIFIVDRVQFGHQEIYGLYDSKRGQARFSIESSVQAFVCQ